MFRLTLTSSLRPSNEIIVISEECKINVGFNTYIILLTYEEAILGAPWMI